MRQTVCAAAFIVLLSCFGCQLDPQRNSKEIFRPGALAPAFDLATPDGMRVSSEALKGKVVLLNFWATWCEPCVAEMPALERLHKQLESKGLRVVTVNVDFAASQPIVERFIRENKLTFPVLLDPHRNTAGRYGIVAFPETFFIGRDGSLVEFHDSINGQNVVRVVSNREWDSPAYVEAALKLLQ